MATKTNSKWGAFQKATADRNPRTVWLASGEVGTGKTRFALTGPSPILVQSLDRGLEGVVEGILGADPEKEIYVKEYDWNPQDENFNQQTAIDLRDQIIADFEFGLANARTIVWDKETDMWEVFRYAEFGGPSDAPKDYAKLNQRYFHLINRVKSTPGVNMCLIQSMKDEWGSEATVDRNSGAKKMKPIQTGRRIRTGFSRLDEIVFFDMHHRREKGEFFFDIGKCRQNASLSDQSMPAMTFAEFGTLLVDGTEESDWV